jgi:hypothetical protein
MNDTSKSGKLVASVTVIVGIGVAFAFALQPFYGAGHRLDVLGLVAGLTPYALLAFLTALGTLQGRLLAAAGLGVLAAHLAVLIASGGGLAFAYWTPLALTAILAVLLPRALKQLRYAGNS